MIITNTHNDNHKCTVLHTICIIDTHNNHHKNTVLHTMIIINTQYYTK